MFYFKNLINASLKYLFSYTSKEVQQEIINLAVQNRNHGKMSLIFPKTVCTQTEYIPRGIASLWEGIGYVTHETG